MSLTTLCPITNPSGCMVTFRTFLIRTVFPTELDHFGKRAMVTKGLPVCIIGPVATDRDRGRKVVPSPVRSGHRYWSWNSTKMSPGFSVANSFLSAVMISPREKPFPASCSTSYAS